MRSSLLVSLSLLALGASACAAKSATTVSSDGVSSNTPPRSSEPVKPPPAPKQVAELPPLELGPIYYELDSATLKPESRRMLELAAESLRQRTGARVTISGHTCELGTTEYNLALGQRRAASARDYLVKLGVEPERISAISYGEERPAEAGHDESSLSRNRRSEFTVSVAQARAGGR
jgi:peptidoglycan-associated lipoprotein